MIASFISCPTENYLFTTSPCVSSTYPPVLSCFRESLWWLAKKKARLPTSPIPNPQPVLVNIWMEEDTATAFSLSCTERFFFCAAAAEAAMTETAERSWCMGESTTVWPAPCARALESRVTLAALLLPSLLQLVCGGRYFYLCNDLPDAALLKRMSFLWLS